jgi:hypothetical protein
MHVKVEKLHKNKGKNKRTYDNKSPQLNTKEFKIKRKEKRNRKPRPLILVKGPDFLVIYKLIWFR